MNDDMGKTGELCVTARGRCGEVYTALHAWKQRAFDRALETAPGPASSPMRQSVTPFIWNAARQFKTARIASTTFAIESMSRPCFSCVVKRFTPSTYPLSAYQLFFHSQDLT